MLKRAAYVCLWFCAHSAQVSSWQRGDSRSLENGDRAVNGHTNSPSVLMRKSAVPKRMTMCVQVALLRAAHGHTSQQTNVHKRLDTCQQAQKCEKWGTNTSGGGQRKLIRSLANFKGVSIFRPEQLDTSKMDQAHQSPACA